MKPYYEHAGVTIYHADCREILPGIEADICVSDPPWGVGINTRNANRGRGGRKIDRIAYPQMGGVARAVDFPAVHGDDEAFDPTGLLRFSKLILWGANHYADKLPASACWLVWDRKTTRAADSDITDCELAWTLGLPYKTVRIFRHMWAGFQRDSEVGKRVLHPTQKPIALFTWAMSLFPKVNTVVDPYMGSGPVLAAAKLLGHRAIGIEIEERYCEIAAERLQQDMLPFGDVQ